MTFIDHRVVYFTRLKRLIKSVAYRLVFCKVLQRTPVVCFFKFIYCIDYRSINNLGVIVIVIDLVEIPVIINNLWSLVGYDGCIFWRKVLLNIKNNILRTCILICIF